MSALAYKTIVCILLQWTMEHILYCLHCIAKLIQYFIHLLNNFDTKKLRDIESCSF